MSAGTSSPLWVHYDSISEVSCVIKGVAVGRKSKLFDVKVQVKRDSKIEKIRVWNDRAKEEASEREKERKREKERHTHTHTLTHTHTHTIGRGWVMT